MRKCRWLCLAIGMQAAWVGCTRDASRLDAREEARLDALVESRTDAELGASFPSDGLSRDESPRMHDLASVKPEDTPYVEVVKPEWLLTDAFDEPEYRRLRPGDEDVEVPDRLPRVRFAYRHIILYVPGHPPRAAWVRTAGYWGYPGFVWPGPAWWEGPDEWYWGEWWQVEWELRFGRVRKTGGGIPMQAPPGGLSSGAGTVVPRVPAKGD